MENWCSIILHYDGQWDDSCNYIGGQERLVYIPIANISVAALRSNIQVIFYAEAILGEYNIYYTAQSRSGRFIKSLLVTDLDLQRLIALYSEPHVYIVMNYTASTGVGTSNREPSPYRPFFLPCSPPPYQHFSPGLEDLQRFGDSLVFGTSLEGGSRSSQIPNLNDEPPHEEYEQTYEEEEEEEENINTDHHTTGEGRVVDSNDEEEDEEFEEESSDDEDFINPDALNFFTVADFSAWIRSVGGMSAFISNLMPTHPLPDSCHVEGDLNNWLVPIISLDSSQSPVARDVAAILDRELSLGSIFYTKDDLLISVSLLHMEQRVEFKVVRSSSTRVEYTCKRSASCSFFIRASCRGSFWIIRKFHRNHDCVNNPARIVAGSRNVRSKAVAAYFARNMRRQGSILKPREIMMELQASFGIRTSYGVALKARNAAISMIYGGIEDSFSMLPKYLEVLRQYNPGTLTDLDIAPDGRFRYCFVALGVSRNAFQNGLLRPVIVVDGTHLKGRNKGVLFVAVTKDGNENVFPLAICVGSIENDECWTWFMSRLWISFGCTDQMLIVSDQHISISNAISEVYPGVPHGICFYHLLNKMTGYGKDIAALYQRAAYAYRSATYQQAMDRINQKKPAAFQKLLEVGPDRWARSQCPVRRYSFLTSNAAEVFNARLLDARRLPICSIIDTYRGILEKWFDEKRAKASAREDILTEEAVAKLTPLVELSHTYSVVPISAMKMKVTEGGRTWRVDLELSTCDCRELQLDLIPCSHAVAAISHVGLNPYDYVSHYYKTSTWREIYGGVVQSLPPQDEWDVSAEASSLFVLPPIISGQAGRPRSRRLPSGADIGQSSSSRQRAQKKCSICRSETHTKRRCSDRTTNN